MSTHIDVSMSREKNKRAFYESTRTRSRLELYIHEYTDWISNIIILAMAVYYYKLYIHYTYIILLYNIIEYLYNM